MGDEHIDIDAALKDHPPEVIAAELAKLHNVDRDAYLKDGITDAQFLDEMRGKALPKAEATTAATPAEESTLSGPSNMTNVVGGGIAAIGGAIPGMGHAGINAIMNRLQPAAPIPTAAPTKQFASPSEVSSRVTAAGQPPRPQGPTDVVNWAMGKDDRTGQYGRGYLGGTSQEHEAALHKQVDALEAKNPGYKIKPGTTSVLIPESEYNRIVNEMKAAETTAKGELQNKAKMAAELRANRLAQINPANAPLSTKLGKVAQTVAQSPTGKRFMTGYNVADMLQAQNPFEATVSAAGAAAPYSAGLIEKVVPQKYKGLAKLLSPAVSAAAPAINWLERKIIGPQEEPVPQQAEGGLAGLQHFKDGKLALAENVVRKAAPSLKEAWEYGGKRLGKASEFFGNELEKAKGNKLFWLPTEADRMGGVGGPSFSANQIGRPKTYKENTWGSAEPGTASRYANIAKNPIFGGPQSQIWSPLLGTETQHQGNQIMFDQLLGLHKENMGKLSPEDIERINNYFRSNKVKAIQDVPDFDIRDVDRLKEMGTTFPVRAAIASHGMGGVGTGGMKGQSFDYASALRNMQDPMTIGAPTHSMGPRAFNLHDVGDYRPDLNAAFPHMITGKDKGVLFNPVPKELALMDYTKLYNEVKGDPGYMGYTKGLKTDWMKANDPKAMAMYPRQEVTAPWIRELEASGYADGGEVEGYAGGKAVRHAISQIPEVAQALEAYLRGHITNAERMDILNKHLPIRKWNELPPNYTDDQIRAALKSDKQAKALADVPAGMQVGNRLGIPAYTQNGVYVDTVHNAKGTPISYNRTGHLQDVQFSSRPNQAARVGLGTKAQALTPMGAEFGSEKSPFALMKGTNIGTSDDEVRRMMQEYLNDPNWTQIGMDPRRNSQFYDKSTGLPVFSATEKLQSGPLVMVPKGGLETSHWADPRLQLTDERLLQSGKDEPFHYEGGGKVGALAALAKKILPAAEREANKAKYLENSVVKTPMYHGTSSDITEFKPKTAGTIFVTSNPRFAESFGDAHQKQMVKNVKDRMSDKEFMDIMRNGGYDNLDNVVNLGLPARQNIMPVHVNATNPFDYENPQHVEALFNELNKADGAPSTHSISHGAWDLLEIPHVQAGIKNLGHDSYFVQEGGQKNLGLYDPAQLKSAIGNEGTYNPLDPDITKADGGLMHLAKGGHATPAWQRSEGKNPEGGLNAAGRASYNREHGAHLKAPQPEGGSRKDSFCARMSGMKKKLTSSETANDPDSRINKSLRKWKC
jgi:hypothetical protein